MVSSYPCSKFKCAMVFLCGQLFQYYSRNTLPNCLKPCIEPSRSWLNQFNTRLVKVIEKRLQVNPLVTSSSVIIYLNCKIGVIGYAFPSNLSRTGELNSMGFTSCTIHEAKCDLQIPLIALMALSIGMLNPFQSTWPPL